jgi:hypothetical protein
MAGSADFTRSRENGDVGGHYCDNYGQSWIFWVDTLNEQGTLDARILEWSSGFQT